MGDKTNPCDSFQPGNQGVQCECPDLGLVPSGKNVLVADQKFCSRRLLNPTDPVTGNPIGGLLAAVPNGLGTDIKFTNAPCIPLPVLSVAVSQVFSSLVACQGANGALMQVQPSAAGLVLQSTAGGGLEFVPYPPQTIPDPLSLDTLNLATALNANGTSLLAGLITLGAGTIAGTALSFLGINAANHVITAPIAKISKAVYYENASETDVVNKPNAAVVGGSNANIGNELYDLDGIAHLVGSQTVVIDAAGEYEIQWTAEFNTVLFPTHGLASTPSLYLAVGGNVVSFGQQQLTANTTSSSATVCGIYVRHLNGTNQITLIAGPGVKINTLQNVRLVLTKFQ